MKDAAKHCKKCICGELNYKTLCFLSPILLIHGFFIMKLNMLHLLVHVGENKCIVKAHMYSKSAFIGAIINKYSSCMGLRVTKVPDTCM